MISGVRNDPLGYDIGPYAYKKGMERTDIEFTEEKIRSLNDQFVDLVSQSIPKLDQLIHDGIRWELDILVVGCKGGNVQFSMVKSTHV